MIKYDKIKIHLAKIKHADNNESKRYMSMLKSYNYEVTNTKTKNEAK